MEIFDLLRVFGESKLLKVVAVEIAFYAKSNIGFRRGNYFA
jgi:hypothetical protein